MKVRAKGTGLWILSPLRDLGLFVLVPVWAIPLLWMTKARFDPNGFGTVLLAIGGVGHHLPGFIRAYTDPLLFRRFRTRFTLAPLFFLGVYVVFSTLHLEGLKLILILWGTWHGAMQVNGFLRIYDSKVGSFSRSTSWLDWGMCLVWFVGGLLFSSRLIVIFSYFFNAGGPPISPAAFVLFRQTWMFLAAGTTVAFVVNAWRQARAGTPANPVKLLMMVSSFVLWWFAMVRVTDLLVGLLLFEIVHDVQYNALVWVYNERRVRQGMTASFVEKFLFRPSVAPALVYVVLVLGYGSMAVLLGYAVVQAPSVLQVGGSTAGFWTGLFIVSSFLHFYFDGFIWQVRESDFREGIGIGKITSASKGSLSPGALQWIPAGGKWAFFLIPAAALGFSEYRTPAMPVLAQYRNVAQLIPDRWQAQFVVGLLEKSAGDEGQAIQHLKRAAELNPSFEFGESMLADIYSNRGDSALALQHYLNAAMLNPADYAVRDRLGKMLVNAGHIAEAIPHLQVAANHNHADANLSYVLGASFVSEKRELEGLPYLQRAVQLDPQQKQALNYLGIAMQRQGRIREAAEYYRQALEVDPQYLPAKQNLEQAERLLASKQ